MSNEVAITHVPPVNRFLRNPMNWLLVFIPITVVLDHVGHVRPPVLFFCAALAIIPIAALIVSATEQLATRTGDAIGGLLNANFRQRSGTDHLHCGKNRNEP